MKSPHYMIIIFTLSLLQLTHSFKILVVGDLDSTRSNYFYNVAEKLSLS
jgi:hypothetical protein